MKFYGSFDLIMFAGGMTAREYDQVRTLHITNGSNIHNLKNQMTYLNSQQQLPFLTNMACIIPCGEDKGASLKYLAKGIPG